MTASSWLGIDPGARGALAILDIGPNGDVLNLTTIDMPTVLVTINKKQKQRIDLHKLATVLDIYGGGVRKAVIEDVGAMPGQGVSSSFAFGFAAGAVQMGVAAARIPVQLVRPAVWKKHYRLNADKDAARVCASRLMPAFSYLWPLVKHDGRAEAALLALYGSQP